MFAALSGCALEDAPPAPTITTADQLLARRLDDDGLQQFLKKMDALPKGREWNFKSLYWTAIYLNPDLRIAKAQIGVSKAAEITAAQRPNPTFTLPLTHDTTTSPAEWLYGVGFNFPIETNGKRDIKQAIAQSQTENAQLQAVNKAWDVRVNVLTALVALAEARETLALNETATKTQKDITAVYDKRLQQGQLPTAVSSQAQISYQQALLQLEQARTSQAQARIQLATAIGVPVEALDVVTITTSELKLGKPSQVEALPKAQLLQHHPALLAALSDYQIAQQNLQLELANRIPDIDLGPGYQWDSHQGGIFTLNISFTLPIFNNNEGPVAEASAKRIVAARQVEATQATLLSALQQAEFADQSARREWQVTNGLLSLQQNKLNHLRTMLGNSEASTLPLLYATAELQTAQLAQLASESKWRQARVTRESASRVPLFGKIIDPTDITDEAY